jgi:hypothetical protein
MSQKEAPTGPRGMQDPKDDLASFAFDGHIYTIVRYTLYNRQRELISKRLFVALRTG